MNEATEVPKKPLDKYLSSWRRALTEGATGPLVIAREVVEISERWDDYREEVGGLTVSAFLRRELGRGRDLAFFRRRARAVERLGEDVRRVLHHEVAVWIDQNFEGEESARAAWGLRMATKKDHHGVPFSLAQAKPIVLKLLGRKTEKVPRTCERCALLEEENRILREKLEERGIQVG
jgi:hypothetical protein